jgi:YjbE family integral membrane protein
MNTYILIISGILKITMLDIVLSGDNIGIIALATKDLSPKLAKKASFIGVIAAITLRIIFTCLVTYILMIQWLPIKLFGGALLVIITWNLIKPNDEKEMKHKATTKLSHAIYSIVLADLTMSLDNVLAIAGSAHGNVYLIIFGLLLNIPIIFWGSLYVAKVMREHPFIVYIGAAVLAHTAFDMMLHDNLLLPYLPIHVIKYLPYAAALFTLIYGVYVSLFNNGNTKKFI